MSTEVEFNDDREDQSLDQLDAHQQDFDWGVVFAAFGEPELELGELQRRDYAALGHAVRSIFRWLLKVGYDKPCGEHILARRLLGLAWVVDPSLIEDSPSLSAMSRHLDCDKMAISIHTSAARRKFGIRNRAAQHAWNFGKKRLPKPTPQATVEKASFRRPARKSKPKRR